MVYASLVFIIIIQNIISFPIKTTGALDRSSRQDMAYKR